jgi:hydroxymethylpyrimidine pyrophosphatase-like HAD family hydrolase
VSFQAIAYDYDRTLADAGRVAPQTLDVLRRAREADRKLILITGRTLGDLRTVFSELSVFNTVVVENGATLFDPALGSEEPLCAPPPPQFLALLRERRVLFSVGKRVVASVRPYETAITRLIEELNLDLEIAFNRESIVALPFGVDKAAGLTTALSRLGLKPSGVVGIGDAKNDISFLRLCGFSVAVANAIDSLKEEVDVVTRQDHGAGAAEIIEQVIAGVQLG